MASKQQESTPGLGRFLPALMTSKPAEGTSEKVRISEDNDILRARCWFLYMALCSSVLGTVLGILCYYLTDSLTVQLDFFSSGADGISIMLNICVEYAKTRMNNHRYILSIDLLGGFVSLLMLLSVVMFGVANAMHRSEQPFDEAYGGIEHTGPMLVYNFFTITMGGIAVWVWFQFRDRMGITKGNRFDWINVVSGFLHVLMDLLGSIILFFTTCWLIYLSYTPENHWLRRMDMVRGDAVGSLLICFLCVVSTLILIMQSFRNAYELFSGNEVHTRSQKGNTRGGDIEQKVPISDDDRLRYGSIAKAG